MRNFWVGNNRIVDDEEWYGSGGAGIVLSGSDWLGLGELFGSVSAGTELCGARPIFAGKSRDAWEECNKKAMELMAQQQAQSISDGQLTLEQIKSREEIEKRKRITTIVIVSIVSVAVLLTIVLLARKK